jgi:hypothetical protein
VVIRGLVGCWGYRSFGGVVGVVGVIRVIGDQWRPLGPVERTPPGAILNHQGDIQKERVAPATYARARLGDLVCVCGCLCGCLCVCEYAGK